MRFASPQQPQLERRLEGSGPRSGVKRAGAPAAAIASAAPAPDLLARSCTFISHVGEVSLMLAGTLGCLARRPLELKETVRQIEKMGVASLGLVTVTSSILGMVMATQFAFGLQKFGGMEYTPRVIVISLAQELAPTFVGIIVGGRIAAGIAAELGSMAVTEQIDAIRALGADPLKKLVMPRLLACVVVMPILSAVALVVGFGAALLLASVKFSLPAAFFLSSALQSLSMADFLSGIFKTPFFGAIIAIVGCHCGMGTRGGTEGVGAATTQTVVAVAMVILVTDLLLTQLGYVLWPLR